MRLGAYPAEIMPGTNAFDAYREKVIAERHRHRYEFNNEYLNAFEQNGMVASGLNPDSQLVEIMEIPEHKWFVAVQFHPELKSRPNRPHPIFASYIRAALG